MESGEGDGVNLVGIEGEGGESHGVRTNVFFLVFAKYDKARMPDHVCTS